MPLAATARSPARTSSTKSTDAGVPRSAQVRPYPSLFISRRFLNQQKQIIVWLACALSFLLALPSLGSSVAFSAATSIATIGLYISYGACANATIIFLHLRLDAETLTIHTLRDTNRAACDIRGPLRARAVPSRQALARNRQHCCALDRVYRSRVLSTAA